MGTRSSTTEGAGISAGGGYLLAGTVLEVNSGSVWQTGEAYTLARGGSVAAWWLRWGRINDVDVSGQVVLSVASHPNPGEGGVRAILVDERATPEQALALLDAFGGRLGGPLAMMAGPTAEAWRFAQVPIEYGEAGRDRTVWVPDRLRVAARLEAPGEPGHWPARSLRLHRTAKGQASEVSVQMPEHGLTWHDQEAAAISSEFRWDQMESGFTQDVLKEKEAPP